MQDSFGKLERISIHGYKSIRRMDSLELNAINIIIGNCSSLSGIGIVIGVGTSALGWA